MICRQDSVFPANHTAEMISTLVNRLGDLFAFFAAHPFVTPPFPMLHAAVGHRHCVCAESPRSCFSFFTNQLRPVSVEQC